MKPRTYARLAGVALVVLLAWFLGLLGSLLISKLTSVDESAHLGTSGDTFGSSTALFSALSFFGLLAVLWVEMQDRRQEREESQRPLLAPELISDGLHVLDARKSGPTLKVSLILHLRVQNISNFPALNVALSLTGTGLEHAVTTLPNFPIKAGGEQSAQIDVTVTGKKAIDLFAALASGQALEATLASSYDSLQSVRWTSSARYELRVPNVESQGKLRAASEGSGGIKGTEGAFAGPDDVFIEMTPVEDSWMQVRGSTDSASGDNTLNGRAWLGR